MRNAMFAMAALGVVAACAAGGQAVMTAKTARYQGDRLAMFAAAKAAVAAKYPLASSDEMLLHIATKGRWYTPEGLGASERAGDMRDVPDRSVNLRLVVKLLPEGETWRVSVEPIMLRYFVGRPNPDTLALDDPSAPGWASGRVDQLYAAIHSALAPYAVAAPGTMPRSQHALPEAGTPTPESTQLVPR